jgi:short-subunit dehydrogenase
MTQLQKKPKERVLVTGASTGIGAGLAQRFARAGHDLVLVARSGDKLKALAEDLTEHHGVSAVTIAADLAKDGEVARLAATLKRRRLNIDILVNNAGINHQGRFKDMAPAAHQEIIRLNIAAATDMLARFIPPMVERGYGRVLNVGSTSSFVPVPFMATYAASKAYLLSLTESLSEELKGTGVTLTALCPGVTATPMMDTIGAGNPDFVKLIAFTVLDVKEVASAGYDACMRGQVIRIPGKVNLATTLSSRAVPKWVSRRIYGFIGRIAH